VDEAEKVLWAYNHTKYSYYSRKYKKIDESPIGLHEQSEKRGTTVATWQAAYALHLQKKHQIRNCMIDTDIQGVNYLYAVPDSVALTCESVLMSYDLENLETIFLFDVETEKYLGEGTKIERIQGYGKDANFTGLGRHKQVIKGRQKARIDTFRSESAAVDLDELSLLLAGKLPKAVVEAAETAVLSEGERDVNVAPLEKGTPQYNGDFEDEDDDEFDAAAFRRTAY
jgi:hypothetical protein